MRQFVLPSRYMGEPVLTLTGGDFHYLVRVLRKREGDSMEAVTAAGARCRLEIERIDPSSCRVEIHPEDSDGAAEAHRIRLCQCLPKGRKMDLIVRQAVEAGVGWITPLLSEHTVPLSENSGAKLERWQRIAKEALQQSGNRLLPRIDGPRPFPSVVKELAAEQGIRLFFHEERIRGDSLHRALAGIGGEDAVSLLIGPEGGLSKDEVAVLSDSGFIPVFLGDSVLRAETAALYAIAAVKTILLEKDQWKLSEQK
jgi:16S rRNA (uracil1498-N3)-methyltransferase